jgi:hypothetical protein
MRFTSTRVLSRAAAVLIAAATLACVTGGDAIAAIIQVTIDAQGGGTIGGTPFGGNFKITTQYNTANRTTVVPGPPGSAIYGVPNIFAVINLPGIGNATFTQNTRIFVNQTFGAMAGFSRDTFGDGQTGGDILQVEYGTFPTWDMLTPVGPVFDSNIGPITQAQGLATSLGTLDFIGYANATFQAVVAPEPATAGLLLTIGTCTITRRRRE